MSPLARRVHRAIRSGRLWGPGDRLAVAVSGGADSVALALLLAELAPRVAWTLSGLIHVHHGLRGEAADADARFCRQLAERLGLPSEVVDIDVRGAMAESGRSLEATARMLRYDAFESAARRLGATVVATGHTADDQAETVMLRLLRGAGHRGVSAIRPRRGLYARPLLACRRDVLRAWLAAGGETWREDASNEDRSVPRNLLRQDVMPIIERGWPGAVPALARFAELAADDERWLTREADEAAAQVVRNGASGVELIRTGLSALPRPVGRRVVRAAIEAAGGTATFRDIEELRRVAASGRAGSRLDLHGLAAECTDTLLRIGRVRTTMVACSFEHRLEVPGEIRIPETGGRLRASLLTGDTRPGLADPAWDGQVALQASTVRFPLVVRSRRAGDRLTPLGAPGSRSLQDVLVDRKVPRAERQAVPVVTDAEGRIVWVAPLAMADRCRVRTPEAGMVILEFKKGTP